MPDHFEKRPGKSKFMDGHNRGFRIKKEQAAPKNLDRPCRRTVEVRLRYGGNILVYDCGDADLDIGVWVIVKHQDVTRIGMVTSMPTRWSSDDPKDCVYLPKDREFLRVATIDDMARQAENQLLEQDEFEFCHARIKKLSLPMKLVTAEITFDNYKSIFYYTADERVDFRQLVKDLVRRLRTRVEMRQISVRHEALMLGGMGMCGRQLCCSSFLKNFTPVSVRMAKEQNLSINTVKISGVCGRLMCCLAFENQQGDARRVSQGGKEHKLSQKGKKGHKVDLSPASSVEECDKLAEAELREAELSQDELSPSAPCASSSPFQGCFVGPISDILFGKYVETGKVTYAGPIDDEPIEIHMEPAGDTFSPKPSSEENIPKDSKESSIKYKDKNVNTSQETQKTDPSHDTQGKDGNKS
jgi:cell fate regulator YaaT (PSP1 superfamily)